MNVHVHPSAIVEPGVEIGAGTSVWDNAHLRGPCRIGRDCIVGDKAYIAYGVVIGDRVKLNTSVYVCTGVAIEDGVMVAAHVVFTNDRFPRATTPDLTELLSSEPGPETLSTTVREGATIGAGAVIGPGIEVGRFAMVGMGAVVTHDVGAFHLVTGNPARVLGAVCRCGRPTGRADDGVLRDDTLACDACGRRYVVRSGDVVELAELAHTAATGWRDR